MFQGVRRHTEEFNITHSLNVEELLCITVLMVFVRNLVFKVVKTVVVVPW